ncbi:SDR family oxidoreductase [Siccirubricoccus sp. KC 17139]|uniref:SDR family oxidoreductase n=1 Tax=Siccirubricoccus soli TaxID=2899147 RepID=A0ABT1D6E8_9PROT|nr:SDR family NAD(P)-dependent oxidoreductase [Siccirubricoccus soli]MCO6417167.1 SDR family oxidoreductase [Siccirubricoccus soli]MCP2683302.1 SDR family oxidoreductase [Siccirubricoccus soli]
MQDRLAVVTGAANGLGEAIARRLKAEGARLALFDIDAAGLATVAEELDALAIQGDVTEESMVQQGFARIAAELGPADVLVNNVGGSRNQKIWEMSVEAWDFTLRLNLRSAFLCTRAVLPGMMERRCGAIICMSSGAKEGTPWSAEHSGAAAYSTAKAGIHGFIRDVALEVAPYNIRVNAVAPGPIATPRTSPLFAEMEKTLLHPPSRMVPMARIGEPVDIANAVLYLASDEASYVTGVTLDVAGGR